MKFHVTKSVGTQLAFVSFKFLLHLWCHTDRDCGCQVTRKQHRMGLVCWHAGYELDNARHVYLPAHSLFPLFNWWGYLKFQVPTTMWISLDICSSCSSWLECFFSLLSTVSSSCGVWPIFLCFLLVFVQIFMMFVRLQLNLAGMLKLQPGWLALHGLCGCRSLESFMSHGLLDYY